jgi:hypothetical protein
MAAFQMLLGLGTQRAPTPGTQIRGARDLKRVPERQSPQHLASCRNNRISRSRLAFGDAAAPANEVAFTLAKWSTLATASSSRMMNYPGFGVA